jgi:amino acid transporter
VIALMYHSFGQEPPTDSGGIRQAFLWLAALLFVAVSAAMLVVINFFSLFFGVTLNFLGRNGVKFRFLHLFRRIPLVGVTLPVLFGYAIWHNVQMTGPMTLAFPSLMTMVFAIVLMAAIVWVNILLSRADRG